MGIFRVVLFKIMGDMSGYVLSVVSVVGCCVFFVVVVEDVVMLSIVKSAFKAFVLSVFS